MNLIFALYCMLGIMWFHEKCTAAPELIESIQHRDNKNHAIFQGYTIDDTYNEDDILDLNKRQLFDDYGHMRFGKRDQFNDYGYI